MAHKVKLGAATPGKLGGKTSDHLYSVSGTLRETLSASGAIIDFEHGASIGPVGSAFDSRDTAGVRYAAGATNREIDSVWLGSGAASAGLQLGDKLLSINAVAAPGVTATAAQKAAFRTNYIAARSGATDAYSVLRGANTLPFTVAFVDWRSAYRHGMQLAAEGPSPTPTEPKECDA